jgi:hypothetical protein
MELKDLEIKTNKFTANGKEYYVESKLSIERFIAFQKLEVEFAYQTGFGGVMKSLKKGIELLNSQKWTDAAVELHNTLDILKKSTEDKRQPAIDICSLFINQKDEDRRWVTDEMLKEKQEDFEAEGIPMDFFLHLAANLVIGYKEALSRKE